MMRYLTGKNSLMRARTATRFQSFFLRLGTCDDQDREGSISSPKRRSSRSIKQLRNNWKNRKWTKIVRIRSSSRFMNGRNTCSFEGGRADTRLNAAIKNPGETFENNVGTVLSLRCFQE